MIIFSYKNSHHIPIIKLQSFLRFDMMFDERGGVVKPIDDKNKQVQYLRERLEIFLEVLDSLDVETADIEVIDRLIQMIDDIEEKMEQFKNRPETESN